MFNEYITSVIIYVYSPYQILLHYYQTLKVFLLFLPRFALATSDKAFKILSNPYLTFSFSTKVVMVVGLGNLACVVYKQGRNLVQGTDLQGNISITSDS